MDIFEKITDVKSIRKNLKMNQFDFWGGIGITQSGGSRYESKGKMPKPVIALIRLVYINGLDLKTGTYNKRLSKF